MIVFRGYLPRDDKSWCCHHHIFTTVTSWCVNDLHIIVWESGLSSVWNQTTAWSTSLYYLALFECGHVLINYTLSCESLQWRHNGHGGVPNHQPHHCLLVPLFRGGSERHQSSALLTFVRGIYRWPVNLPHKGQVTRNHVSIWWRHHVPGRWKSIFMVIIYQWMLILRQIARAITIDEYYITIPAPLVSVASQATQLWQKRLSLHDLPWKTTFWSPVKRLADYFHSQFRHSWK